MEIKFLENKKGDFSLSVFNSSIYVIFFVTVITNIVSSFLENSHGLVYTFFKDLYDSSINYELWQPLYDFFKMIVRIFDAFLNSLVIVVITYGVVLCARSLFKFVYKKSFRLYNRYLCKLVWEDIVPNIVKINSEENDLYKAIKEIKLKKKINLSEDTVLSNKIGYINLRLAYLINAHNQITKLINDEGLIEYVSKNNDNKKYMNFVNLREFDFDNLYTVVQNENKMILALFSQIENGPNCFAKVSNGYKECNNNYDSIVNRMNEIEKNKSKNN